MKAKLKFKNKQLVVEDIKKVSGLNVYIGLMFKGRNTDALLFNFEKGRKAIHSLFCNPFLAVWILDGKIVDYKFVNPFKFYISPNSDFDTLIEIPLNEKYDEIINFFSKEKI